MARLGALKPLRGTASGLANIVLQEGEIAFDYLPSGTYGDYGIKMGDGSTKYSNLPYLIKRNKEDPTPPWEYDTGTDEAALLHNIEHCDQETIGKIYYIQSYMFYGGYSYSIQQDVPYKVIGINHDGTSNTVDLQSMVAVHHIVWNSNADTWQYGKYTTSGLYDWVGSSCQNGYSDNIKSKMVNMTERWREATGNTSGTLQTRSTKVKLLNPFELFGKSIANYSDIGSVPDFTQYNYGQHYSGVFSNSTSADTNRVRYRTKNMSYSEEYWTNSWYAYDWSITYAYCFLVKNDGSCDGHYRGVDYGNDIVPVIRLQG
jgi:hypothetical protein